MSDKPENPPENPAAPIEGAIGEIEHGPSAFEQFLDKNQKKLVIGGVVLILGLVSYVVLDGLSTKAEKEAAAAVSSASDISELRTAIDEHSGTNAAGAALYKIGLQQWEDQRQDDAIASMEQFIAEHASHPLIYNAKAALGSYQLQLGEVEKAKAAFDSVSAAGQGHELYGVALLNLGDIALREGDNDAAKGYYERIGSEFAEKAAPGLKKIATERITLVGVSPPMAKKEEPVTPPAPVTPPNDQAKATPVPAKVGGNEAAATPAIPVQPAKAIEEAATKAAEAVDAAKEKLEESKDAVKTVVEEAKEVIEKASTEVEEEKAAE